MRVRISIYRTDSFYDNTAYVEVNMVALPRVGEYFWIDSGSLLELNRKCRDKMEYEKFWYGSGKNKRFSVEDCVNVVNVGHISNAHYALVCLYDETLDWIKESEK